jgi:diacylglycerol kinase family enzyme
VSGGAGETLAGRLPVSVPPQRVAVVLNAAARGLAQADPSLVEVRVAEALTSAGLSATIRACRGEAIESAAREAADCGADAVVAGGGDGTVSAAASALAGGSVPLGVLPLGTLNHFARDLAIPQELAAAARTIAAGVRRTVDVGRVNGRVFLNNSSIGLYPEVVHGREELRHRAGVGKWLAMLYAAAAVLRRFPLLTVTLQADGRQATLRTPFVFVGNNVYELRLLGLGRRQSLESGVLSVYLARHQTRAGLLMLAVRTLLGRLDQDRDFRALELEELEIDARRPLRVSADGELRRIPAPIRYRVEGRALDVLAPARPE